MTRTASRRDRLRRQDRKLAALVFGGSSVAAAGRTSPSPRDCVKKARREAAELLPAPSAGPAAERGLAGEAGPFQNG
jgi:hypothetical protein